MLINVFNDVRNNGLVEGTKFAEGWLCPIYKKGNQTNARNYRLITILNMDYKILTKLL